MLDPLGLGDLLVCSLLDEAVDLLLVDLPLVVLALMPVNLLVLAVPVGGQSAEELPLDPFNLILLQLVPYLFPLVSHGVAFGEGFHRSLGFLLGIEVNVAGRVVDPLYFEMRMDVEVLSDHFIRHVVDSEKIPGVCADLDVVLAEIRHCLPIEEL